MDGIVSDILAPFTGVRQVHSRGTQPRLDVIDMCTGSDDHTYIAGTSRRGDEARDCVHQ